MKESIAKLAAEAAAHSKLYQKLVPEKQARFIRGVTDISQGIINSPSFGIFKREGFKAALTDEQEQQMRALLLELDKPPTVIKGVKSVVKNVLRMQASPRAFRSIEDLLRHDEQRHHVNPDQIRPGRQSQTREVALNEGNFLGKGNIRNVVDSGL